MSGIRKEDWTGAAASVLVHVAVLLLLAFLTTTPPDEQPIGFLEVNFGPIAEGRPVQRAPERPVEQPQPTPETEEMEETPPASPPEEAKPVELPDQVQDTVDDQVVETPESEVIAPEQPVTKEETPAEKPQPEQEAVKPLGSGALVDDTADTPGEAGTGSEPTASAPFQIEGLNRVPNATPLPVYAEQVNADIRVRITVNPQGRIVERFPLMKGNPSLERAVMDALLRWQFNPLPPNAPQENQTGIISFRFRLR